MTGREDLFRSLPDYPPPDVEAPLVVWEYVQAIRTRLLNYQTALVKCAVASGADVSDGVPTRPALDVWAVREVEQLRRDYDEAIS